MSVSELVNQFEESDSFVENKGRCPNNKPICLKKKQGKYVMTDNCAGNPDSPKEAEKLIYSPIEAIERTLKYANIELEGKIEGEYKNKDDNEETCYDFERAWLVIITDIINKLQNIKENPEKIKEICFAAALMNDSELNDNINKNENEESVQIMETVNLYKKTNENPIILDLADIFEKIITVGEKRFEIDQSSSSCKDDDPRTECVFIKKLRELMKTNTFINLSDDLKKNSPDNLLIANPEEIKELTTEEIKESVKHVITLFQMTLHIMNKKENLRKEEDEDLKFNSNVQDLINFFNGNEQNAGRKTKKNKKKKSKGRKGKKGTTKRRKSKRKQLKGGMGIIRRALKIVTIIPLTFLAGLWGILTTCDEVGIGNTCGLALLLKMYCYGNSKDISNKDKDVSKICTYYVKKYGYYGENYRRRNVHITFRKDGSKHVPD